MGGSRLQQPRYLPPAARHPLPATHYPLLVEPGSITCGGSLRSRTRSPTMPRVLPLAGAAMLLLAMTASAQDGPKRPSGSFSREAGEAKITFTFEKDTFNLMIAAGEVKLKIDADYSMTKDNIVYGRINKVERAGLDVGPKAGDLFSFKLALKDK